MKGKLIKTGNDYLLRDSNGETLAITSGSMEGRMLSLKNCQSVEWGYDLDELLDNITPKNGTTGNISERIGFVKGFKKCLELMGDKKFSEEDVVSMIEKNRETGLTAEFLILTKQQTEWDVEVEMDICGDKVYAVPEPKLDADGCLILKIKSE